MNNKLVIDKCSFECFKYNNSYDFDKANKLWNNEENIEEKNIYYDKINNILKIIDNLNKLNTEIFFYKDKIDKLYKQSNIQKDINYNESKTDFIINNNYNEEKNEIKIDYISLLSYFSPLYGEYLKLSLNTDLDDFVNNLSIIFNKIRNYLNTHSHIIPNFIKEIRKSLINDTVVMINKCDLEKILKNYTINKLLTIKEMKILLYYLDIEDKNTVNIILFLNCILDDSSEPSLPNDNDIEFEITQHQFYYTYTKVEQKQLIDKKRNLSKDDYENYINTLFNILLKIRKRNKKYPDKFWNDSYIIETSAVKPVGEFVLI